MHRRYNNYNISSNVGMMVRHRRYTSRISQLQNYGNGPSYVSYRNMMRHHGNMVHQQNYGHTRYQQIYGDMRYQQNYDNVMHRQFNGNGMPQPQFRSYYNNPTPRAIRGSGYEVADSLFPHGDPLPEEWTEEWSMRPDWPRARWTYQDNPTWQPPVKTSSGEYSGTELIKAKGEDVLTTKYDGPSTFYKNIRTQPWQLVSAMDPHAKIIAKNSMSDYGRSDSSDSSSMKSYSSVEWSTSD